MATPQPKKAVTPAPKKAAVLTKGAKNGKNAKKEESEEEDDEDDEDDDDEEDDEEEDSGKLVLKYALTKAGSIKSYIVTTLGIKIFV